MAQKATTETDSTETIVEVLQMDWTRDEAEELQFAIRLDGEHPSTDQILDLYECVGVESFQHKDTKAILGGVWERWNRGSGVESRSFIEAETRSLSVGDVVTVGESLYLCTPFDFEEVSTTRKEIEEVLNA